jgi:hypothetical protein
MPSKRFVKTDAPTSPSSAELLSGTLGPTPGEENDITGSSDVSRAPVDADEDETEGVEMWNRSAPGGPEWGGPRGDEPTKFGDWARNGRVSDF